MQDKSLIFSYIHSCKKFFHKKRFHSKRFYKKVNFSGEFRGGRLWGKGLLSYTDGSPGTEGYFQDVRFSKECSANEDIKKSRKIVTMARKMCDQYY